ncbi:MAG: biliverdin-producing heme oxygenase [Bacteroidota bacterium]|nr:biliverdin-producing heme oxygenase [Bacteroidota bacterium]
MSNTLLSEQLKIRTLAAHQELEKILIGRLRAMQDQDDYIGILQLFYSYFGALEDRINLFIGIKELPDYLQRRKSDSLIEDVQSLGGVLAEKIKLAGLPVIENHLQAFGAMYVMEGSTLGGLIISQMVVKQLNIDKGLLFFQSYGAQQMAMWETFKLALNRYSDNETDAEVIINSADATFRQFKSVLNSY